MLVTCLTPAWLRRYSGFLLTRAGSVDEVRTAYARHGPRGRPPHPDAQRAIGHAPAPSLPASPVVARQVSPKEFVRRGSRRCTDGLLGFISAPEEWVSGRSSRTTWRGRKSQTFDFRASAQTSREPHDISSQTPGGPSSRA